MRNKEHPLYRVWSNMVQRCTNPNRKDWAYYGGRGIQVCDHWRTFLNFARDMFPLWAKGLTLDRKNPDLGYNPSNCRWASWSRQQINRRVRSTNITRTKGVFRRSENGKFRCGIMVGESWKWLGTFVKLKDAIAARKRAEGIMYAAD